jgi:hypothetical protein
VTVTGRVVEVTPNVTGQIVAIPVKPNVPVKANDVLFQIDPAPFQSKVTQLQASLAGAKQQVEILKAYYEQATANVTGLTAQVAYNKKRLADIDTLAADMANTEFQAQDKQVQHETVSTQLGAAKAAQQSAKLALDSEIGGVDTTVAQLQAQLDNAQWELSQTAVRAPPMAMSPLSRSPSATGHCRRARRCRSSSRTTSRWSACFRRTAFRPSRRVRRSTSCSTTFRAASITRSPKGIGQGQIAVSGTLARTTALGGATVFPAEISIPDGMSRDSLRLGATAFAGNAGVIGLLASILVWDP